MSGIAGIIQADGAPVAPDLIERMTSEMAYRGPDGIQHWTQGAVAFGHCMLQTTTESLEEIQPLANDNQSIVLVMDGRIDNWEELRRELLGKGAVLRTHSDAELVLRAYEVWGDRCLSHFDGDFSFVIWDARTRCAFCARDRLGVKPFHYHWDGSRFIFATDLRAILAIPGVPQVHDECRLVEFMADEWLSRERTLWSGISRLMPAHSLRLELPPGAPRLLAPQSYWNPAPKVGFRELSDEAYIEQYRALFIDVVRRRSRSHRPVAYEVSGGLDSSAIFCAAAFEHEKGRLPAPSLCGYTLDFQSNAAANEIAYARAVGQHTGHTIQEVPPTLETMAWFSEQARAFRDFPTYPNGTMQLGLYAEAQLHGARALMTGLGGDQWLDGSPLHYADDLAATRWRPLLTSLTADLRDIGPRRTLHRLLRYGCWPIVPPVVRLPLTRWRSRLRPPTERDHHSWLTPPLRALLSRMEAKPEAPSPPDHLTLGQLDLWDTLHFPYQVQSLEMCDRAAALAGLELRHPLFSAPFVEYAFALPGRLRLRGGQTKWIHRRGLTGLLPAVVAERQDKAEFSAAFDALLQSQRPRITADLSHWHPEWVIADRIDALYQAYMDQPEVGWRQWVLWNLWTCSQLLDPSNRGRAH